MNKWSENDKELLKKLNHLSARELSSILGKPESSIALMRRVLGLRKRVVTRHYPDRWTDKEIE